MKNLVFSFFFSNFEKSTKKTFHVGGKFFNYSIFPTPLYNKGKSRFRGFNKYATISLTP